ncbi:MAG: class I SAM-dependent methyltransferase [Pelobium sp.]
MSHYKDYGFVHDGATHMHKDIYAPLLKHLAPSKTSPVLDLGCGNGSIVRFLLAQDYDAYGTDASPKGIEIAEKLNPGRFAIQDLAADELPQHLKQIKFKTIISTEVIEHLYDPRTFIRFCKQILIENGGGSLILTTPYHGYLKNLMIALSGKWDRHADPLWDGGHIKLWSKHTLSQLVEEQGFKVIGFEGCGRVPYVWKSMMLIAEISHA